MSTITATNIHGDTIRKTGGSLGVDIRVKNTSVYESDGGTSVTQNLVQGLAKYFVHYVQATPAVNKSFNNSSVSDDATGKFTINYTNAFADANYGLNSGIGANTTDAQSDRGGHSVGFTNGGTVTTTSAPVNYLYGSSQSSASTDIDTTSYHTLYGDLA
tara:strand:- start:674 stop:1150 length:477 start_codon:yes stop_codon:yes gene_type:complete